MILLIIQFSIYSFLKKPIPPPPSTVMVAALAADTLRSSRMAVARAAVLKVVAFPLILTCT